jgi:hypothetical protein
MPLLAVYSIPKIGSKDVSITSAKKAFVQAYVIMNIGLRPDVLASTAVRHHVL